MSKLDQYVNHMRSLVSMKAPPCIKAHYLVRILLPRVAVEIGVKEVAEELSGVHAEYLCDYSGTCRCCKMSTATTSPGEHHCAKCLKEFEALERQMSIEDHAEDLLYEIMKPVSDDEDEELLCDGE